MPKNPPELTAERLRELLSYNPETGVFRHNVSANNRVKIGDVAGRVSCYGYRHIGICRRLHLAHRLAWLYVHGQWPEDQLDHINGIRDDNRIANLREASCAENPQNRAIHRNNTSGFPGVCKHRNTGKWRAHIRVGGKNIHLGIFNEISDAAEAYTEAKKKLHHFQPVIRSVQLPK